MIGNLRNTFTDCAACIILILMAITACRVNLGEDKTGETANATADANRSSASQSSADTLNLSSDVIRGDSGEPLEGADVYILGQEENSVKTDSSGSFNLGVPKSTALTGQGALEKLSLIISKADDAEPYGKKVDNISLNADKKLEPIEATELGTIKGIAYLRGRSDSIGIDVYIPGTSFIAKTDHDGSYTISYVPEGTWEALRADFDSYVSAEINAFDVASADITTIDLLWLSPSTGPWGSISINEGAESTLQSTVLVYFEFSDRTILMKVSEDPLFIGSEWEPVAATKAWVLSAGDGLKTVYVTFQDKDGISSSPQATKITVGESVDSNTTVDPNTTVIAKLADPVFAPAGGSYSSDQNVTITAASGATIYYTTDNTAPSSSSTVYASAIAVSGDGNTSIKAIAVQTGLSDSNTVTATYSITYPKATTPTFTPSNTTYSTLMAVPVGIASTTTGAIIHYTIDGSDPNAASDIYSTPIIVGCDKTVTVKAIAVADGMVNSPIAESTYTVPTCPVVLFDTPTTYNGNLGGRAGANQKCLDAVPSGKVCAGVAALLSVNASDLMFNLPTKYAFSHSRPLHGDATDGISFSGFPQSSGLNPSPTIANSTGVPSNYWTGTNWNGQLASNCNAWTDSGAAPQGETGDGAAITVDMWLSGQAYCSMPQYLLCICF